MPNVHFTNWEEGLKKVSLTLLLQNRGGLPLREAKDRVDRLLDGEAFMVECATHKEAEALASDAAQLGAVCTIQD